MAKKNAYGFEFKTVSLVVGFDDLGDEIERDIKIPDVDIHSAEQMKHLRQWVLDQALAYSISGSKDSVTMFEKLLTVLESVSKEFNSVREAQVNEMRQLFEDLKIELENALAELQQVKERLKFYDDKEVAPVKYKEKMERGIAQLKDERRIELKKQFEEMSDRVDIGDASEEEIQTVKRGLQYWLDHSV